MPHIIHMDAETRSGLTLDRISTRRYAGEESTEALCVAYAVDDGPVELWTPGAPVPAEFTAADPDTCFAAHNANFEFSIVQHLLAPRSGWPAIPIERFICTMARARAAALPGSLDGAAAALGLSVRKDRAGAKLMKEIAARKREPTQEDLERLHSYCLQDVEVERELFRRLPPLTEPEQALWLLDHRINLRGIPIDRELAIAVADLAGQQRIAVNSEIAALTGGKITTANQRDKIIKYLAAGGCDIASLTKESVKKALANGLCDDARKLLGLRAIGSQAAASKVKTLLAGLDDDDRLRETLVFHGSAPGRWSGRRFQPQNLKKPAKTLDVDSAIAAIKSGELGRVEALGQPLSIAADVSRGLICARPGHVLIGADFSAVESRVLAWLADDKKKLATYRAFDETGNPELEPYCVTASNILGRKVTPADEEGRGIGKTADLALGFGGSVGAWRKLAPNDTRSDEEIKANVSSWRAAHPQIVRFWSNLEIALKRAVRRLGQRFTCGRLSAESRDGTLWMTLPSGRSIAYPQARLVDGKFEDTTDIAFKDNAMGKWREVTEWYGTFVENAVQATARDLLAAALVRLEAAGFEIIAHVHDEAIAEIAEGEDPGRVPRDHDAGAAMG
jgi:DNA polymerase